jgi:hypothetical protein
MRLRQVATTQSVTFIAPIEVAQSIVDTCDLSSKRQIQSCHVLYWLMEQTCLQNEMLQGLFLAQGVDYCNRKNAEWLYKNVLTNEQDCAKYVEVVQRPEKQKLDQLYGEVAQESFIPEEMTVETSRTFMEKLEIVRQNATNSGLDLITLALEEVEQEREVEHQVEEIRVVRKPPQHKALAFSGTLHQAIVDFMKNGDLAGGQGFMPAFEALQETSIGRKYTMARTTSKLYVSTEYMRTVEFKKHDTVHENFMVSPIPYPPVSILIVC